jgi:hypothetical protein
VAITVNGSRGALVPIPTLFPETAIGEFPIVALPLNAGTTPDAPPLVVTVVCANILPAPSASKHAIDKRFIADPLSR